MSKSKPYLVVQESISDVVSNIKQGSTPTEALRKTAIAKDLNPNFIHLVGEAINTALHYGHMKTGEDKTSDFPIIRVEDVVKSIFTKQAADNQKIAHYDYDEDHTMDIAGMMYSDKVQSGSTKQAFWEDSTIEAPRPTSSLFSQINKEIKQLRKEAYDAEAALVSADFAKNDAFLKLASYFKRDLAYRTSFPEFETQAYAQFGEAAMPYVDLIHKEAASHEARGEHLPYYSSYKPCVQLGFLDDLQKKGGVWMEAEEKLEKISSELTELESCYKEITAGLHTLKKKEAGWLDGALKEVKDFASKDSKGSKHESKAPEYERKMLLQDLILTDPILKKEDPNKIKAAYEQFMRLAPEASREKEVVRSVLREAVAAQSMSPHSGKMFSDLDLNMAKQKAYYSGKMQLKL